MKKKQNIDEKYWGKPVTGFEMKTQTMIIGLAPLLMEEQEQEEHLQAKWRFFKSLHSVKISNQNYSKNINDGLKLRSTITIF